LAKVTKDLFQNCSISREINIYRADWAAVSGGVAELAFDKNRLSRDLHSNTLQLH
jgi:hypothetical protein